MAAPAVPAGTQNSLGRPTRKRPRLNASARCTVRTGKRVPDRSWAR